jgi:hypothetical protein
MVDDMKKILELKKAQMRAAKARGAKEELELTILERTIEIERIKEHILLQEKLIADAEEAVKSLSS